MSRARCWLGTYQVAEKDDVITKLWLESIFDNTPGCTYVCGQLEKGTHYHVQFYVHFSSQ